MKGYKILFQSHLFRDHHQEDVWLLPGFEIRRVLASNTLKSKRGPPTFLSWGSLGPTKIWTGIVHFVLLLLFPSCYLAIKNIPVSLLSYSVTPWFHLTWCANSCQHKLVRFLFSDPWKLVWTPEVSVSRVQKTLLNFFLFRSLVTSWYGYLCIWISLTQICKIQKPWPISKIDFQVPDT